MMDALLRGCGHDAPEKALLMLMALKKGFGVSAGASVALSLRKAYNTRLGTFAAGWISSKEQSPTFMEEARICSHYARMLADRGFREYFQAKYLIMNSHG